MEQLDYNLLFGWFVGLEIDEPVGDHTASSKSREWLLNLGGARQFLAKVKAQAQRGRPATKKGKPHRCMAATKKIRTSEDSEGTEKENHGMNSQQG